MVEDLKDLELEESSLSSGPHNVRKSISLNLTKKTKLKAKSSVKSSKSRRSRDGDDFLDSDGKGGRRGKISEKRKDNSEDEELDWSHKIVLIGEKVQNPMIHLCENCKLPILIYGRLSPCKHVFCLTCAEKSFREKKCKRCEGRIERIEPTGIGQIYVCTFGGSRNDFSGCRRSYLSHRDLVSHIRHRHEKEGSSIPENELLPNIHANVYNPPPGIIVQPGLNIRPTVVLAGLPNNQQQIFLPTAAAPAQFQTLQPLSQSQYQGQPTYQFSVVPAQIRQSAPNQNIALRGEWDGTSPMTSTGQDWNTRGTGFQQPFYK